MSIYIFFSSFWTDKLLNLRYSLTVREFWRAKNFGSQSSDVGMNTPDRTEKAGENGGKEVFMEFVHKIW